MANDWILDVLADLRAFATKNGLSKTAEQLDDATLIATLELGSDTGRRAEALASYERKVGFLY